MLAILSQLGERRRIEWEQQRSEHEAKAWAAQIDGVLRGRCKSIILAYGPRHVDDKLHDLVGMNALWDLTLEGSDITRQGLASIARIPNLQRLSLLGFPPLNNEDFGELRGNGSLVNLVLVYTHMHQVPLPVLATLPQLRTLEIFDRGWQPGRVPQESDWHWLKDLRQLKVLSIGGAGVTEGTLRYLQKALPDTTVLHLKEEPSTR